MVSLSAVEHFITQVIDNNDDDCMATNIPDAKKGEAIALLYTSAIEPDALKKRLIDANMDNLMLPKYFILVDELPKLGSGKKDFGGAKLKVQEYIDSNT